MMINVLTPFVIFNVGVQLAIAIAVLGLCRGSPRSWWFAFFGFLYLVQAAVALDQLNIPVALAEISSRGDSTSTAALNTLKTTAEFWKFIVPAISLGIGCSMIANFFSASKH